MGLSSDLFLRISEDDYFAIPENIREIHLRSKIVSEEKSDWNENMKDTVYAHYYHEVKIAKSKLSEREYQLREERRKINK